MFRGARRALHFAGVNLIAFLRSIPGYFASWPMQELTGTTALADNVALALGRNVVINPGAPFTFTLGVLDDWSIVSTPADPDVTEVGTGEGHGGVGTGFVNLFSSATAFRPIISQSLLSTGTWYITIIVDTVTSGSIIVQDSGSQNSETINAPGTYNYNWTITGNVDIQILGSGTTPTDVTLTSVTVQQTGILDSGAGLGLLDGTYSGVTLAQTGAGNIPYMVSFDGVASYLDWYSAELNSGFNPDAGTLMIPCRAANAGVWTDGSNRNVYRVAADGNNAIYARKQAAANQFLFSHSFGGSANAYLHTFTTPPVGLFLPIITWDVPTDTINYYINDTLVSTDSGVGVFVGNLSATDCVIGAFNATPGDVWHGDIAYPILFTSALPQTTIAQITAAFGV